MLTTCFPDLSHVLWSRKGPPSLHLGPSEEEGADVSEGTHEPPWVACLCGSVVTASGGGALHETGGGGAAAGRWETVGSQEERRETVPVFTQMARQDWSLSTVVNQSSQLINGLMCLCLRRSGEKREEGSLYRKVVRDTQRGRP